MNCSMQGLPVHHKPPESTQTHAHRVGDAYNLSNTINGSSRNSENTAYL